MASSHQDATLTLLIGLSKSLLEVQSYSGVMPQNIHCLILHTYLLPCINSRHGEWDWNEDLAPKISNCPGTRLVCGLRPSPVEFVGVAESTWTVFQEMRQMITSFVNVPIYVRFKTPFVNTGSPGAPLRKVSWDKDHKVNYWTLCWNRGASSDQWSPAEYSRPRLLPIKSYPITLGISMGLTDCWQKALQRRVPNYILTNNVHCWCMIISC